MSKFLPSPEWIHNHFDMIIYCFIGIGVGIFLFGLYVIYQIFKNNEDGSGDDNDEDDDDDDGDSDGNDVVKFSSHIVQQKPVTSLDEIS